MKPYIIALDAGTTSNRAVVFDRNLDVYGISQSEFSQYFPKPGWVEHDPTEIWATQTGVLNQVIAKTGISPEEISAIGISNQRETTILWDAKTGKPVYNAIVWQCRRTAAICDDLVARGFAPYIRENCGLIVDAYFSGTKIAWILDHVAGLRERAEKGEILFGTVDTWLVWNLTGGVSHVTDRTNASRTMLFNIRTLEWDDTLLEALNIPRCMLPKVCSSSEIYGTTNIQGVEVPISGIAGDQQAALFGQRCFDVGQAKNTYGTGGFLLMNTGGSLQISDNGLLTTIAATPKDTVQYALEGSIFVAGAVIQWLRDELKLLHDASDSEHFAKKEDTNGGVYLVPAFTGLGAPHWDPHARGSIQGITRDTNRNHIIRAALESIAYQTADVIHAMESDLGHPLKGLMVDGGASRNDFLMQFQADILNARVHRPVNYETTAMGAAMLAGLGVGLYQDLNDIPYNEDTDWVFLPEMDEAVRTTYLAQWHKAVSRSLTWEEDL